MNRHRLAAGMLHRLVPAAARPRRITPLHLLVGAIAVAAATFGAAQALATPGSGAVSTYVARGPVTQPIMIGVPLYYNFRRGDTQVLVGSLPVGR